MKALYALSAKIASFDFFSWLVLAKAAGYTEVVFDTRQPKADKWSAAQVAERFETILRPGPALGGLPYSLGTQGEDRINTDARYLIQHVRNGGKIEPLRSVFEPGDVRYTVTLREEPRLPHRNSNITAWRTFAAEIGALVIEDHARGPIDLHVRMALYAGADMNFFVPNGPMHLASLAGYPMMCFACNKCEGAFGNIGIAVGEEYPWHNARQHLVWEDDELPVLRRHFAAWQLAQNEARAAA